MQFMDQSTYPTVFMRGGTSKGLFFHRRDVPGDPGVRDRMFLAALGSPDGYGRQLDGMGGGISSLSKVMVVERSSREGHQVDYTFGQVAVDRPLVDVKSNCGNLSAAIGPFAVDEGLVEADDGPIEVRLYNTNTDKTVLNRFEVRGGRAAVTGDTVVDGVSGSGAPVELVFPDPGGAVTGRLLPTGNPVDTLAPVDHPEIEASLVDATNPVVFIRAADLGLTGAEGPDAIAADRDLMRRLEAIRRAAAVAMGLADDPEDAARNWQSSPKIAMVAAPQDATLLDNSTQKSADVDLTARVISMGIPHRAIPQTSALCMAVAANVGGTLPAELRGSGGEGPVRIGHPSGHQSITAVVEGDGGNASAVEVSVTRTVRRLMAGEVYVPTAVLEG